MMKGLYEGVKIVALVVTIVMIFVVADDIRKTNRKVDELSKLKENTDIVSKLDSTLTARETVYLDSLHLVREELDSLIKVVANENKLLRRQNAVLARRFDDIVLGLRPEY